MKNFFGIIFIAALNLSAIMFEDASCTVYYDDIKESLLIKTELVIPSDQYSDAIFPKDAIKHSNTSLHFIPVYRPPHSLHLSLCSTIYKPQIYTPVHRVLIILRKNNSWHQSSDDDIPSIDYLF